MATGCPSCASGSELLQPTSDPNWRHRTVTLVLVRCKIDQLCPTSTSSTQRSTRESPLSTQLTQPPSPQPLTRIGGAGSPCVVGGGSLGRPRRGTESVHGRRPNDLHGVRDREPSGQYVRSRLLRPPWGCSWLKPRVAHGRCAHTSPEQTSKAAVGTSARCRQTLRSDNEHVRRCSARRECQPFAEPDRPHSRRRIRPCIPLPVGTRWRRMNTR